MGLLRAAPAIVALFVVVPVALAGPRNDRDVRVDPTRGPHAERLGRSSRSLGWPWRGRLVHAVELKESPVVSRVGEYREAGHFFGTWELVQLVERAAWRVHLRAPGAKLQVGELSAPRGRALAGHRSHQSGRDVDLGFYLLDGDGDPVNETYAFAKVRANGECPTPNEGWRFDDARNWELVAKLVADGDARVQYIFVARGIQRRVLAEGRRRGAPQVLLDRAEAVMVQPAGSHPHANHFHVRIYCAPGDRPACRDRAPFHPWYPGNPPLSSR